MQVLRDMDSSLGMKTQINGETYLHLYYIEQREAVVEKKPNHVGKLKEHAH